MNTSLQKANCSGLPDQHLTMFRQVQICNLEYLTLLNLQSASQVQDSAVSLIPKTLQDHRKHKKGLWTKFEHHNLSTIRTIIRNMEVVLFLFPNGSSRIWSSLSHQHIWRLECWTYCITQYYWNNLHGEIFRKLWSTFYKTSGLQERN